jgi:S-DNA-T family DNA segregation ATPase FtsK/SpoIIIE
MTLPAVRDQQVIEGVITGPPRDTARRRAARVAGRNAAYPVIGAALITKRLWDSRTTARYERWIRSAEADGDRDAMLALEDRLARFRKERHDRRMDILELPVKIALAIPKIGGGILAVLAAVGTLLAIARQDIAEIIVPVVIVSRICMWAAIVFSVSWGPILLALPWVIAAVLWQVGRNAAAMEPAGWTAAAVQDQDGGLVVTADTLVLALQHLPIPALRQAFGKGWTPAFHTLPVRDGRGYSAVFSPPLGVTAQMIADQRPVFARNVHRAEVEAWITDAERGGAGPAGSVSVWIADSGVLSKAAPEYPLLHDGTADVFTGVPGGVTPRGDGTLIPVVANNMVAGGQMGQGKSNACRVVMLGCALDPLAELDVFVFANNGDFDAYAPRLARYRKGIEDDTVAAAVQRLGELYEEVGRREHRLSELGAKKVTRGLARQYPDMRPYIGLFSECHELFGHPEYGDLAAELATKTVKRARKTAITLLFDTQSSRKEAIPPKLVELVSVNVCFYVKTWRSNDGFLGDGSFAAGIRATELRPGRDRGTSVITGVSDSQFELLRWYFVEVNDDTGYDAAAGVIARAVKQAAPGVAAGPAAAAIETRDLLADLDEVLGSDRVRLADVPALLRDLAPAWTPYKSLNRLQLRDQLEDLGVRVTNTSNVMRLDPADLRAVIARRGEEE